jgi:hypothetical protein
LKKNELRRPNNTYQWEERKNSFMAKRAAEDAAAEREPLRQRHTHSMHQAAAAEAERQRQAEANAALLRNIGNAFRNAYPSSGTNCRSTNYGGTIVTNCN